MLIGIFQVLLIITSILLSLLILFQESKGGGLAGALSGYGMKSAFGAKTAEKLTIFTAYVAAVFFALTLFLGLAAKPSRGIIGPDIKEPPAQQAPAELPAGQQPPAEAPASGGEEPAGQEE